MRDINRIDLICNELAELWKKHPDIRFGQFLSAILGEVMYTSGRDPFYLEDENFMNMVKEIPWLKEK